MKLYAWSLGVAAIVAVATGCTTDEAVVGTTDEATAALCGDCASGTLCNADLGKCVECMEHADCGDAGLFCDPSSFECVQCLARTDCDDDLACVGGECSACRSDADCGDGATCDEDAVCEAEDQGEDEESGSGGNSGQD